jgi:hypothetical protein
VPIKEGDRVRTPKGFEGKVELMGGKNTLAYVQLDEDVGGEHLTLYESHALIKIDTEPPLLRRVHEPPICLPPHVSR